MASSPPHWVDAESCSSLSYKKNCTISTHPPIDGTKVYDEVATLEDSEFRNLLDELVNKDRKKDEQSVIGKKAQILLKTAEESLREESGSGDEAHTLAHLCHKRKRNKGRHSQVSPSAAARASTGGSLGSLQDLTESTQETSSAAGTKSGGSCGNLSRGSFKTQAPIKSRGKKLRLGRASTSQREGGSLQNLNKAEATTNDSKKLHKSGSLSQVFNDYGCRVKNRRQKTFSESSSRGRRSEEKDEESWDEIPYVPLHSPTPAEDLSAENSSSLKWSRMSDVASGESSEDEMHNSSGNKEIGAYSSCDPEAELISVVTHTAHKDIDGIDKKIKFSFNVPSQMQEKEHLPPAVECPSREQASVFPSSIKANGNLITKSVECDTSKRKLKIEKSDNNDNNVIADRKLYSMYAMTEFLPTRSKVFDREDSKKVTNFSRDSTYLKLKARKEERRNKNLKKHETTVPDTEKSDGHKPVDVIMENFHNDRKSKKKPKKEEPMAKRKNGKEDNRKRKKTALKGSSSVEDLVSKSKQEDKMFKVHKQVTVDDGELSAHNYKSKDSIDYCTGRKTNHLALSAKHVSEFTNDFYKAGDPLFNEEAIGENEFQEVVSKRKNKKKPQISHEKHHSLCNEVSPRNQISQILHLEKPLKKSNIGKSLVNSAPLKPNKLKDASSDFKKGSSESDINAQSSFSNSYHHSFKKTENGYEMAKFNKLTQTSSVPHSECSESDNESVHSVPAKSYSPKHEVLHHSQSSDSTPQASYANIAKLSNSFGEQRDTKFETGEISKSQVSLTDFPPLSDAAGGEEGKRRHSSSNELFCQSFHSLSETLPNSSKVKNNKMSVKGTKKENLVPVVSPSENTQTIVSNKIEQSVYKTLPVVFTSDVEPVVFTNANIPINSPLGEINFGFNANELVRLCANHKITTGSSLKKDFRNMCPDMPDEISNSTGSSLRKDIHDMYRELPEEAYFPNYEEVWKQMQSRWDAAVKLVKSNPEENIIWSELKAS